MLSSERDGAEGGIGERKRMEGGEEGIGERKRMEGADGGRYRAAIIFLAPSSQDTRPELHYMSDGICIVRLEKVQHSNKSKT